MNDLHIRHATLEDVDLLAQFNVEMALETEDKDLPFDLVQRGVARLVAEPERGFYLVAEAGSNIAGCLAITYEWSDWRNGLFWWIQSVYVRPTFRRLGVFRSLYDYVNHEAQNADDVCGIRLYVERENVRAQQTYSQLGMIETAYKLFEVEFYGSEDL